MTTNTHGGRRDNHKRRPDDKRGGARPRPLKPIAARKPRPDGRVSLLHAGDAAALAERLMRFFPDCATPGAVMDLAVKRLAEHTDD